MSEFKGKWERITVDWDLHQAVFVKDREIEICRLKGTGVETEANALLISKAPEMLEMLKQAQSELRRIKGSMMAHPDCTEGSEFDDYTSSAERMENEIENLIKEATEI